MCKVTAVKWDWSDLQACDNFRYCRTSHSLPELQTADVVAVALVSEYESNSEMVPYVDLQPHRDIQAYTSLCVC